MAHSIESRSGSPDAAGRVQERGHHQDAGSLADSPPTGLAGHRKGVLREFQQAGGTRESGLRMRASAHQVRTDAPRGRPESHPVFASHEQKAETLIHATVLLASAGAAEHAVETALEALDALEQAREAAGHARRVLELERAQHELVEGVLRQPRLERQVGSDPATAEVVAQARRELARRDPQGKHESDPDFEVLLSGLAKTPSHQREPPKRLYLLARGAVERRRPDDGLGSFRKKLDLARLDLVWADHLAAAGRPYSRGGGALGGRERDQTARGARPDRPRGGRSRQDGEGRRCPRAHR